MGVDLTIPGDPSAIHALADWLDPKLADDLNETYDALRIATNRSMLHWKGASGDAFQQTAYKIVEGIDPVDNYARDAAEAFRAYAQRPKRGQSTFADYADRARERWLIFAGNVVSMPMPPKQYISAPGTPPPIEYGPNGECIAPRPAGWYEEAKQCYAQIAEDVGTWWGDLTDWVIEHLVPLIARASDFDTLSAVTATLSKGNEVIFNSLLGTSNMPWEERLAAFETEAKKYQEDFSKFDERLRSGDPSVKALAKGTSKAEILEHLDDLSSKIKGLKVGTRILPGIGTAIDVGGAVVDVANGGSISTAGVGLAGGAAGAGAATFAAAGSAVPGGVVVVAAALAAVLVAEGSKWAWEEWVPLDVREAIDAGDFGYVFE